MSQVGMECSTPLHSGQRKPARKHRVSFVIFFVTNILFLSERMSVCVCVCVCVCVRERERERGRGIAKSKEESTWNG